jgi:hypothetical protein
MRRRQAKWVGSTLVVRAQCSMFRGTPGHLDRYFSMAQSNRMVHVRSSGPADAEAIGAVILPIQQLEFGIPITLEDQPDLGNISSFYQHGRGNFWVAEVDERIVGTIALLDIGNSEAALRKMSFPPRFAARSMVLLSACWTSSSPGQPQDRSPASTWVPSPSSLQLIGCTRRTGLTRSPDPSFPRPSLSWRLIPSSTV